MRAGGRRGAAVDSRRADDGGEYVVRARTGRVGTRETLGEKVRKAAAAADGPRRERQVVDGRVGAAGAAAAAAAMTAATAAAAAAFHISALYPVKINVALTYSIASHLLLPYNIHAVHGRGWQCRFNTESPFFRVPAAL